MFYVSVIQSQVVSDYLLNSGSDFLTGSMVDGDGSGSPVLVLSGVWVQSRGPRVVKFPMSFVCCIGRRRRHRK